MEDGSPEQLAICVSDLVVGFRQQTVIDNLSLDVRKGEILGLVGASGSGKSVLMRTIIGLITKRSGHMEVMGVSISTTITTATLAPLQCGASCSSRAHCSRH